MRDDYLSADWSRHHASVSRDLHKLSQVIAVALAKLHRVQFDAPWRHEPQRR